MSFDPTAVLESFQSKLQASARYGQVDIGDPEQPPSNANATYACVVIESAAITEHVLNGGSGSMVVTVRLYRNMTGSPSKDTETELGKALFDLWSDLMGDFDLGVTDVRNVQPDLTATWTTLQSNTSIWYRAVETSVGVFINDIVSHAA